MAPTLQRSVAANAVQSLATAYVSDIDAKAESRRKEARSLAVETHWLCLSTQVFLNYPLRQRPAARSIHRFPELHTVCDL